MRIGWCWRNVLDDISCLVLGEQGPSWVLGACVGTEQARICAGYNAGDLQSGETKFDHLCSVNVLDGRF